MTKKRKGLIQILSLVDGAFSNVRKKMVDKYNHHYEYNEIDHDYKELLISVDKNGGYLIEKNYTFGQEVNSC